MAATEHLFATPDRSTRLFISALGWVTIVLAISMAILPRALPASAANCIGIILMIAAVVEIMVGTIAAAWATVSVLLSGFLTVVAALMVFLAGPHTFFTLSAVITGWLIGRAALLLALAFRAPWRTAMMWLLSSGTGNLFLASLAIVITMSTVVAHTLFGPAPKGSGYSVIPALSLFFNGISFAAAAIAPGERPRSPDARRNSA